MPFSRDTAATAALHKIADILTIRGERGYIVGGFIRDRLLGRSTNDVDIAVRGDALAAAREVAAAIGGTFVLLDDVSQIARVVVTEEGHQEEELRSAQWYFDFSSFSGDIESDLARRDFTIDAMAFELNRPATGRSHGDSLIATGAGAPDLAQIRSGLIDPFYGQEDLRRKIVRRVSDAIFDVDAIRLLRAVRLAAELDFTIEPGTERLIRSCAGAITGVAGERIREELLHLLRLPQAAHHLRYMDELGLLLELIPELAEAKGVEQPTVHYWDVFEHSLQTVAALEFLLREGEWQHGNRDMRETAPWSEEIDRHLSRQLSGGSNHRVLLKLAALLHDVAKPLTKTIDDTGRARFIGHTRVGAAMAVDILARLRFSNREIGLMETMVYHHLRPAQMTDGDLPSQRAIYRYFRDTEDAGVDILLLALADYLASRGPLVSVDEWKQHCRLMNYIIAEHEKQSAKLAPMKLLNGHDIMREFGLEPGPRVGELMAMVHEAQASGEVSSREEAFALVRNEVSETDDRQAKHRSDPKFHDEESIVE
ncbi:MAG: HD domain-containing protein [Dehalococcoidia bacterium]